MPGQLAYCFVVKPNDDTTHDSLRVRKRLARHINHNDALFVCQSQVEPMDRSSRFEREVKFVSPSRAKPFVADLNACLPEPVLNDLDIRRTTSGIPQNDVRSEFKQQVKQESAFAQKLRQHDERETFQPPLPPSNLLLRLDNPSP